MVTETYSEIIRRYNTIKKSFQSTTHSRKKKVGVYKKIIKKNPKAKYKYSKTNHIHKKTINRD